MSWGSGLAFSQRETPPSMMYPILNAGEATIVGDDFGKNKVPSARLATPGSWNRPCPAKSVGPTQPQQPFFPERWGCHSELSIKRLVTPGGRPGWTVAARKIQSDGHEDALHH